MVKSHERIFPRIILRFVSFPSKTYSKSILSDVNVLITCKELINKECALSLYKTCTQLTRRVQDVCYN